MKSSINLDQKLLIGGLLIIAAWLWATPARALEVVFKKEAAVNGDTIYLKDIASFNPAEDGTAARLGNIIVAAAPAPGETLNLSRQLLQYKIGPALLAGSAGQPAWPENVVVKRAAQLIGTEQFEEIFKGYIRKNAPWKSSEIFFSRISTPGTIALPQGRLAIEVQDRAGQTFLGNVFLTAQVNVNGRTIRNVSLSGEVLLQKEIIRAARKIDRGTVITKDDLSSAVEKIKDLRPDSNPRLEDIVGKRATRNIAAGQILSSQMMQEVPMVQKGRRVIIKADNGLITVTTIGVVQENGQPGDQIKVINLSSGKEILATVAGPGLVTVSF